MAQSVLHETLFCPYTIKSSTFEFLKITTNKFWIWFDLLSISHKYNNNTHFKNIMYIVDINTKD